MNILHTKVYFTVHKQTKLWVKEVERERATWYLGSSKSWFTKSYLIFFSLPAFKGWKDSKSSSQQPAGACYPIQPQPHTVILPKWIPNEMVYFRHKVSLALSKCLYISNSITKNQKSIWSFAVQGPRYQNRTKIVGLLRLFRTLKMAQILRKNFAFNLIYYSIGTLKLHEARTSHFSFALYVVL